MPNESMFNIIGSEFVPQEAMQPVAVSPSGPALLGNPVRGVRMPHGLKTSLYFVRPIPYEMTLATGITFTVVCALAGENSAYLGGGNAMLDVTAVPLVSGTSHPDESALVGSTPAEAAVPMPTVPGTIVVHDLVAPVANMTGAGGTLAAGNVALVRVRRRGDDPGDSNVGDILFIGLGLRNT